MIVRYFYGDRTPIRIEEYHSTFGFKLIEEKPCPIVTVCAIFDEKTGKLSMGIARCSEKDRFVKKIGREISYKRAVENPQLTVNLRKYERFSEVFYDLAKILQRRYADGSYKL
jgi:hypothetical protein